MCHSDNISLNTLTVNSSKILKFSKAFKARIIPDALLNYEIRSLHLRKGCDACNV